MQKLFTLAGTRTGHLQANEMLLKHSTAETVSGPEKWIHNPFFLVLAVVPVPVLEKPAWIDH